MKSAKYWILLASLLHSAAGAADTAAPATELQAARKFIPYSEYINSVEGAFRAYQRKEFESAFEQLGTAARWGDKHAQYMLALMYVLGDGTQADFVTGMAWMQVASEAPNRKWRRDLETLRKKATPDEIDQAAELAGHLITLYGMDANEITCNRRAEIGSNVKEVTCTKRRRPDGISVRVPADFPL